MIAHISNKITWKSAFLGDVRGLNVSIVRTWHVSRSLAIKHIWQRMMLYLLEVHSSRLPDK